MTEYKYLGKKVKDIGKPGLQYYKEYMGILKAIIEDYVKGRISKATARGRLLLLYRLTYKKYNHHSKLTKEQAAKLRKKIKEVMRDLDELKEKYKKRKKKR